MQINTRRLWVRQFVFGIIILAAILCNSSSWADTFKVDPDHTTVEFKIKHLLGYVHGTFDEFEGTVEYDPNSIENSKASGTIQAISINTRVKERDKHLRSKDFFDVEQYPLVTFNSTKILEASPKGGKLEGALKIHGVEKTVVLDVEIHGVAKDPWGNVRAAFTATTKINRKDFGLTWNQFLEAGKVLVGDEVFITLEVEGIKQ